jgi:hypothetical protein
VAKSIVLFLLGWRQFRKTQNAYKCRIFFVFFSKIRRRRGPRPRRESSVADLDELCSAA